jgi:hypothetical protein
MTFIREDRYIVIKLSKLSSEQKEMLAELMLSPIGLPTVSAVVVEKDWPEYEPVWKMIENRVINDAKLKDKWNILISETPCNKCGVVGHMRFYEWESSCGGYEDIHYMCSSCGHDWWEEGADA